MTLKRNREIDGNIEIFDVMDLAKILDVHFITVRGYIRKKQLKARRVGRKYWVTKERLREFLNA